MFHTEGITARLRSAGVSYIVITPDLGGQMPDEALYQKRLQDHIIQEQTLSSAQNRFFSRRFDEGIVRGVQSLERDRNLRKAVEIVLAHASPAAARVQPPAPVAEAVSWEEFSAWSRPAQRDWLIQQLRDIAQNPVRMYLLIESATLNDLLREADAKKIWEIIRGERANTVILVHQNLAEVPSEAIGGRFRVDRIESPDIETAAANASFQSRYEEPLKQTLMAAITPEGQRLADSRILHLQKHPVSLLFRLFLSKPELRTLASHPGFLDTVRDILLDIQNIEAVLRAA